MDASEAALQRKNRVLADSSKRLNSLVKGDYDDVPMEVPTSFMGKPKPWLQSNVKPSAESILAEEEASIRLMGIIHLGCFFFAIIIGAFACFKRHVDRVSQWTPTLLLLIFKLLDKIGIGNLILHFYNLWEQLPPAVQAKYIKGMTYGSIFVNLYPVIAAAKNQSSAQQSEATEDAEIEGANTSTKKEEKPTPQVPLEIDDPLVENGAAVARFIAVFVFFSLVGFDLLYNLNVFYTLESHTQNTV
ncbi:hypothetical protein BdWA1_001341 [Babesia duncani]|uniref:Uncharacterized protein n=1 Tax=Babesia duncani TaxID=323732 RepID=A0AAD9PP87_9APIC|nr:hypothetical protein BdWA1_001341 [Babesia duncani]